MSTIAGGSENNNGIRRYHGCSWDGNDYDEDDCYDGYSRQYGYWKNGEYYPAGIVQRTTPPPPPEITYTKEELKALRRRYANENTIISHLREKSEKTAEFFQYVDYLGQEFKKVQKKYDDAKEEVERIARMAYYYIFVNHKYYYQAEYSTWDMHSVYIAKRILLHEGDIVSGYNCTSKAHFAFAGGVVLKEGISDVDFMMTSDGLLCQKEGIYDIEMVLDFGKDVVRVRPTTSEYNKQEVARSAFKEASKDLVKFIDRTAKLREKVSSILDRGAMIDPENLSETLRRWQCLDRIVEYEIYEPIEKKVTKYGTSY